MKLTLSRFIKVFFDNTAGTAGIEFAVMIPMILTMFMGVVEISNYIMVNDRTEKVAHSIADYVAQEETITTAQLNTIMDSAAEIMSPFEFGDRGHVIITSVHRNAGEEPKVAWQYEGGGTLHNMESKFGSTGNLSPLPSGFTLNERDTVIIAEVYYQPRALVTEMFSPSNETMYKYAFYKPRLGTLDSISTQ